MATKMVRKLVMIALGVSLLTAPAGAEETQFSKNKRDIQSYATGVDILRNFKRQGMDINLDMLIRGMTEAEAGGKLLLSEDTIKAAVNMLISETRQKKAKTRLVAQQDNKEKGQAFLAENKTKEGVVTLPSGLQYKILKAGDGKKPTDADTVEFLVRGTHIDGTEFFGSDGDGQPVILKVSEAIPGWKEALKLMPVGSKWQIFIPSQLAYGQRGSSKIGPYETIIYEIELFEIQ